MISELGLRVSTTCSVQSHMGKVIGRAVPDKHISTILFSSTSSAIRQVKFEDGELQFISKDFPVNLNQTFCLKCVKFDKTVAVLSNCSIKKSRTYPAGSVAFGIGRSTNPFSVETHGFIVLGEKENKTITGNGNLVASSNYKQGLFLVHTFRGTDGHPVYTYYEYSNQAHLRKVHQKMFVAVRRGDENSIHMPTLWERTEGPTYTQKIRCGIEEFNSFGAIIHAYRSMQLENMAFPAMYDEDKEMFERITEDDLYRAGLTEKIGFSEMYNESEIAEYFTYTACAYFDWKFIIPLGAVMLVLVTLYIIALLTVSIQGGKVQTIPFDSKTWFDEMIRRMQTLDSEEALDGSRSGSDKGDELILLNRFEQNMNVGYCRNGVMINMREAQ